MRKLILILTAIALYTGVFGQQADTLTIADCLRIAGERSPLNRQKQISGEALSYKIKNLSTNWYPAIGLNAQATYNSETVDFSDVLGDMPVSLPSLPLDQYKIWADINQQLYDGGITRAQKNVEKANYEADIQQVESDLLRTRQQVSLVYFSLLITEKNSAVLQVSLDELKERKRAIQAGVNLGVVLPENMLAMEAEEIKLGQKLTELRLTREQLFMTMSVLLDSTLTGQQAITEPADPGSLDQSVNRPELMVFDKQKEVLRANQKLISASDLPKFFAFSQAAYGRPGYNILSNDFHTFYSVGLGMKWNFLNYGDNRRQKKILDIQKEVVDIKRKSFNDQLNIQMQTEITNLKKYNELIEQDKRILELRKAITAASLSKLSSGIITTNDYLSDLDAEILAKLQYENHRILKLQAIYNYKLLQGNL